MTPEQEAAFRHSQQEMQGRLRKRNRGCALCIFLGHLILFATLIGEASRTYWKLGDAATSGMYLAGAVISLLPFVRSVVLLLALLVKVQWWWAVLIVVIVAFVHGVGNGAAKHAGLPEER